MRNDISRVLFIFLFLFSLSFSWSIITEYTFNSSNGVYSELSEGTTHGTFANDNEVFNNVPIGFDFNYNGSIYSAISISVNGFIAMGTTVSTSNTPLSTGTTNNVIAPFSRDLKSRTDGTLTSHLSGEAPNRIFTIQWHNYRRYTTNAANDTLNFQIQLVETTNEVTFNYGHCYVVAVTTAATVQCGLRGAANTEFLNRMTTTDWNATTIGTANNSTCTINNTVYPPDGLIFHWAASIIIPPCIVMHPADAATDISVTTNLHWLTGGGVVTGYRVYLGTDNPPTNIVNGIQQNTTTYDPISDFAFQTVYYWKVIPFNDNGEAIDCPIWSFTTMPDPTVTIFPYTETWDSVIAPNLPSSWTVVNANNDLHTWVSNTTNPFSAPNSLRCSYNTTSAIPMDDWIISPPLSLESGSYYRIQFYYKAHNSSFPEKLELKMGTSNNIASLTTQIFNNDNITNTNYTSGDAYINPSNGGIYYIGFHGYSDANMYYLFIDDIAITQINPVFNPPRNLTAVSGSNSINLSWQAPLESVPTGYKVFRDDALLTNTPITNHNYVDNTVTSGVHNYSVTAIYTNPTGESIPTSTVTGEVLRPVTNLQYSVSQDSVFLTWTAPINIGRNRPFTGYNVYRDFSPIASISELGTTHFEDSGQPNGSYIYWITAVYTTGESEPCPFITATIQVIPPFYTDGFEEYPDFAMNFGTWIMKDIDAGATITLNDIDFANEGDSMSFIVFNPGATTPPLTTIAAHSGQKMAACIASTTAPNNDWMISPRMHLGTENVFSLWVRSTNNTIGLERFKVGVTLNNNPSPQNFTFISGTTYVEAPLTWTQYTYQVPTNFNNQYVRFGIKCESANAYILLVDDIKIQGYNGVATEDDIVPITHNALLENYPNPFHYETSITYNIKDDAQTNLVVYNLKGQKVKTLVNKKDKAGNHVICWKGDDEYGRCVSNGIYFCRLSVGMNTYTKKMILMN